jgi:uncharacterized protein
MTISKPVEIAGPIASSERVTELDVLRGVALFGVFLVNMTTVAGEGAMATADQIAALPTAGVDHPVRIALRWLAFDKANTMFAFLFGLGFWLQMERITGRGGDFRSIYVRRLAVLLVFGLIHLQFFFAWDILHAYALCGFILLAMRKAGDLTLLLGGLILAVFGRLVIELPFSIDGMNDALGANAFSEDAAVLRRQALSQTGDYLALVRHFSDLRWFDYILTGGLLSVVLYMLGRFMLGAWVGRHGWLQNASGHVAGFRKWQWRLLPAGLAGEAVGQVLGSAPRLGILPEGETLEAIAALVHLVSTPVLVAGYICAIVSALQTKFGRVLLSPFACVGRMALTNYVMQSFIIGFVLFGVWPGLALAGKIGAAAATLAATGGYALQMIFSSLWLSRFAYGPLEWVWRTLTYGRAPRMRLGPSSAAATAAAALKSDQNN